MEERTYLLEMIGLSKKIQGVKVLDSFTFQLEAGTVHALMNEQGVGESALIKCLFGLSKEDEGKILVNGKQRRFNNMQHALENGIALISKETDQAPKRNVMENIWSGRSPKKIYTDTLQIFDELKVDINPKEKLSNLSAAKRLIVEIAKAVSYNSKIFVLNEVSFSLSSNEIEQLFKIVSTLIMRGCGIIYISQIKSEILRISDVVSIMRNGKIVSTMPTRDI